MITQVSNRGDGSNEVVPTLDPPAGYGHIVHCAAHQQIGFHVPLQVIKDGTFPAEPLFKQLMVVDVIEDDEPVPRRGFGGGSVGPELREDTGVIAARHDLRLVGFACVGVDVVAGTPIPALKQVVEALVVLGIR